MNGDTESLCGAECDNCGYGKSTECKGCKSSDGCPFGKKCFIFDYIKLGGKNNYNTFVEAIINEINGLNVPGLPKIHELFPINGAYVNLEYPLPNEEKAKFLDDRKIYLANQIECEFSDKDGERCFGVVADNECLIVSEYGKNGSNPELLVYKKR